MTSEPETEKDVKPEQEQYPGSPSEPQEPSEQEKDKAQSATTSPEDDKNKEPTPTDPATKDKGEGDDKKDEVAADQPTADMAEDKDKVVDVEVIKAAEEGVAVKPRIPNVPVRGAEPELWIPKTKLGMLVKDGDITNISDALGLGLPLREPEIVDILLPDLDDEVLDVNMVQRMTDSGRRVKFAITTVVGNLDGYVGLGHSKGKEVGPAIRKAIDNAKINIIEIKRGCGSWECGCGKPHSLPFGVKGKSGSVEVYLKPAPRGIDLAVGNIAKHILRLAGIKDAWGSTRGETRTTVNYSKAIIEALRKTSEMKISDQQMKSLHIAKGALGEIRKEGETTEDDTAAGKEVDKKTEPEQTSDTKPPEPEKDKPSEPSETPPPKPEAQDQVEPDKKEGTAEDKKET